MIVFAASVAVPSICLAQIGLEFDLNFTLRGLLGSTRMATLVVALLVIGYFADRLWKRAFLTSGLLITACGLAASAAAPGYAALLAAQALVGVGAGSMEALLNPLVAELNPRSTAKHLNIVNGLFSVGLVIAALASGEIVHAGGSWRTPVWLCVPFAALGALLFFGRGYPAVASHSDRSDQWRRFMTDPLFWLLFVAMVLGGGCEAGMTFWGANFVEHELGAPPRVGAMTIALYGAFMAVGRFGSGALVARIAPVPLMMGSAIACALATLGLSVAPGVYAAWALFALGGLFVACFWPTILAVASEQISAGSATLFALLAGAGISGCVIFPWGIGSLGDLHGLRIGILLLPVSMVLMVATLGVVAGLLRRRGPARAAD